MSAYEAVQKGGLKLKGVSDHGGKKKKKKDKEKNKMKEQVKESLEQEAQAVSPVGSSITRKTKAEQAFEKRKWEKLEDQILEKAKKSHKDRIMDFNGYLDSLTEHFDIPKVSWTK